MRGSFQITWLGLSIVLQSLPSATKFPAEISLRQVSREVLGDPWSNCLHNGDGSTTRVWRITLGGFRSGNLCSPVASASLYLAAFLCSSSSEAGSQFLSSFLSANLTAGITGIYTTPGRMKLHVSVERSLWLRNTVRYVPTTVQSQHPWRQGTSITDKQ